MRRTLLILVITFGALPSLCAQPAWRPMNVPEGGPAGRIFTTARGSLITHGGGRVFRSSDKGVTWSKVIESPVASLTLTIAATPDGSILAAVHDGGDGALLRSTDDGLTWSWTPVT